MTAKLFIAFLFVGCTQFLKQTDDKYFEQIDIKSKSPYLNIAFSHNINGETHPCGCRNYPLGGLPQLAGAQAELKTMAPTLYFDSGDAFFPSPKIPKYIEKSLTFSAYKIAEAFDMLGLNYFLPGDQDFALGQDFLKKISEKHRFEFIMTNATVENRIKHKKWVLTRFGAQKILILGVVHPSLISPESKLLFADPINSLKKTFQEVTSQIGNLDDVTVILLSHSGLDYDKILAEKFEQINWIIGSHSQSFLRYSIDVNNARIVQVLSRNHYMGHIQLPTSPKAKGTYEIIEIRDDKKEKLTPNPMVSWLDKYKKELEELQLKEQEQLSGISSTEVLPMPTAKSCTECHSSQTEFWQATAHSLAYVTLEKAHAANNPSCIGCHSLNYKKIDGFTHTQGIVKVEKKNHKKYWNDWNLTFKAVTSPRNMNGKTRKKFSKKWFKIDEKFQVRHNYANVQCMNCHNLAKDHPFDMGDEIGKQNEMTEKCILCHTSDQSPEWYNKDNKWIATSLNGKYFARQLKKVACPKSK